MTLQCNVVFYWLGAYTKLSMCRPAENHFRPEDYFPPHFGRNFINPTYIYIRACWTIYMFSWYYSVHKSIVKLKNCTVMVWNLLVEKPDLKISRVIVLGSRQTSLPETSNFQVTSLDSNLFLRNHFPIIMTTNWSDIVRLYVLFDFFDCLFRSMQSCWSGSWCWH